MPIKKCTINNGPGVKYGDSGKCYGYTIGNPQSLKEARKKAIKQGLAINGGTLPAEASELEGITEAELNEAKAEYNKEWLEENIFEKQNENK